MQALTADEENALKRYGKCAVAVERFLLLEASARASNKLLSILEDSFAGRELTSSDYLFLQLICDKRKRNFQKLTDVRATQMIFTKLRDSALAAANVGNGA